MYQKTSGAAGKTACVFGSLAGIGGLVHGIGEMLQGNVDTPGIWIYSWTQGPIATNMGGESGITVLPTILLAGIFTIIISIAVIIRSVAFSGKKHGGVIMLIMSITMRHGCYCQYHPQ